MEDPEGDDLYQHHDQVLRPDGYDLIVEINVVQETTTDPHADPERDRTKHHIHQQNTPSRQISYLRDMGEDIRVVQFV